MNVLLVYAFCHSPSRGVRGVDIRPDYVTSIAGYSECILRNQLNIVVILNHNHKINLALGWVIDLC